MSDLPALVWDPGKFEFQKKLGNFVQYFQVNLPTNSYGVPMQLVNPLVIAPQLLDCETTDDLPDSVLEDAIMNVEFEDGMPIIDGTPVWERLDGEDLAYYKLFKEYREMLYISGARAISRLASTQNILGKHLNALAKAYHWPLRCKAYDAYKKAISYKKRQMAVETLETKHSQAAELLMERALTYIEDHPEQLNPKVALQMLQLGMKAGRLALGLNPDKPGFSDGTPSINIQQTTNAGAAGEVTTSVEIGSSQKQAETSDLSYLQSIVHILDKSGALDQAKQSEILDAEYTEVTGTD